MCMAVVHLRVTQSAPSVKDYRVLQVSVRSKNVEYTVECIGTENVVHVLLVHLINTEVQGVMDL